MHHRFVKVVLGIVAAGALPTVTWAGPTPQAAAAQQESPYKDQGEYDLATAAGKETDPQKKLDRLKEWEQKYPDSKLKGARTLMQAQGLLGIALAAYGKTDPPELLDAGQKAAQQIIDNLGTYFGPDVKPAQATDQQWKDAQHSAELQAHSVLGWVAMAKKQDPTAEAEFKKVLELDPNAAQVSYWLGTVIIRQKNVARYSEAFYDIARSLSVTGASALPAAAQTQYSNYLKKAYAGYHGDETGLDQLKAAVATSALPPPNFHIESVEEIQKKQFANEEEFNKAHPDIALWRNIRTTLTADGGDAYFQTIKGSQIPPENIGFFKGKVVSVAGKEIVANVDNAGGDATLKFESAVNAKAVEVGAAFEFKAVVESFTKAPYMLTLTVDDPKTDIKGLPGNGVRRSCRSSPGPQSRPA